MKKNKSNLGALIAEKLQELNTRAAKQAMFMSNYVDAVSVNNIKAIERAAYPKQFWAMQDCHSFDDIADYSECRREDLLVLGCRSIWYAIIANNKPVAEFVDVARAPGKRRITSNKVPWPGLLVYMRSIGIDKFTADLREKTSYKLLKKYCTAGEIVVEKDKEYYDPCFQEQMHAVLIRFINKDEDARNCPVQSALNKSRERWPMEINPEVTTRLSDLINPIRREED